MARKRTTLRDVADAVGVHVSTVSRALNPETRHFIRPEVVETIQAAANRLDYRPNVAAFSLRTNKTLIVGVVIPDIANPVFPPIIHGIEDVLSASGYMSILVNSEARSSSHAAIMAALQARGVDGLIVASLSREDKVLRSLADDGVPLVTVNRRSDNVDAPSVTPDEGEGMRLILEHLRQLGHTRVASIFGPQSFSTAKARYDAVMLHADALGFEDTSELVVFANGLNDEEGQRCTGLALDTLPPFTAIVASNDRLAVGALAMLRERGIDCPQQISVTGFNDMPLVDRLQPALTTVRIQQYEVGRRAAEILLRWLESGSPPPGPMPHLVLPVELVVRASTARAAGLPQSSART